MNPAIILDLLKLQNDMILYLSDHSKKMQEILTKEQLPKTTAPIAPLAPPPSPFAKVVQKPVSIVETPKKTMPPMDFKSACAYLAQDSHHLGDHGYMLSDSDENRYNSLKKAINAYGQTPVLQRVEALVAVWAVNAADQHCKNASLYLGNLQVDLAKLQLLTNTSPVKPNEPRNKANVVQPPLEKTTPCIALENYGYYPDILDPVRRYNRLQEAVKATSVKIVMHTLCSRIAAMQILNRNDIQKQCLKNMLEDYDKLNSMDQPLNHQSPIVLHLSDYGYHLREKNVNIRQEALQKAIKASNKEMVLKRLDTLIKLWKDRSQNKQHLQLFYNNALFDYASLLELPM